MSGHPGDRKMAVKDVNSFRKRLLGWYDRHRRELPWRVPPGMKADPYHVWLSEIMLQQTVVAAVRPYFEKFIEKWPTVHDLAAARQEDVMEAWAGLGYYARARNLHKCAQVVSLQKDGQFPSDGIELKELPGIGDYTGAAIAAIAFDRPATVVDGNVERVVARYFRITEPLPAAKKTIRRHAGYLSQGRHDRSGDFAQAMMDLGATICIPKTPRCGLCPVQKECKGRKAGLAGDLPRREAKKKKPQKFGYIYWITDKKGRVLFERREQNAMLGGMVGLPVSSWVEKGKEKPVHPAFAQSLEIASAQEFRVFHSFTHFDLELEGLILKAGNTSFVKAPFFWVDGSNVAKLGLPSLFKKFVKIMLHH